MQIHIRKALDNIVQSFETENIQYLKHLSEALSNILTTINEEQLAMKLTHSKQINRLNAIIIEKDKEIQKLRTLNQQKSQSRLMSTVSPYRILLKNTKSIQNIGCKENLNKDQENFMDEAFTNINISAIKQNRLSLQIGPSGKSTSRVSSSNIKNRIIHKKDSQQIENYHSSSNKNNGLSKGDADRIKILVSPRLFHENQTSNAIYYLNKRQCQLKPRLQSLDFIKSPRQKIEREQLRQLHFNCGNSQSKNCQKQSKNSSIQQKTRLCRKPSNKGKRQLIKKKLGGAQTYRSKGGECTIPVKTITVNQIKPR